MSDRRLTKKQRTPRPVWCVLDRNAKALSVYDDPGTARAVWPDGFRVIKYVPAINSQGKGRDRK